jgi:hypothetical protein
MVVVLISIKHMFITTSWNTVKKCHIKVLSTNNKNLFMKEITQWHATAVKSWETGITAAHHAKLGTDL